MSFEKATDPPAAKPFNKAKPKNPWKKIAHRLDAAHTRLTEAMLLLEQEPDMGHISGNLEPVIESVKRFRDLAVEKAQG